MALSSDLIAQFIKATNDTTKKKTEQTTVYGTVVAYSGSKYVRLDGSDLLTPTATTTDTKAGERVMVVIKNHTATIIGNISSPSARTDTVNEISEKVTTVETLVADKVSTATLEAEIARINSLEAENVTIKGTLDANSASIDKLESDNVTINEKLTANEASIEKLDTNKLDANIAEITYATIANLDATNANVHNLDADYGEFKKLSTEKFEASSASISTLETDNATVKGRLTAAEAGIETLETTKLSATDASITYAKIEDLEATNATIEKLDASYAKIDLANVNNAWIQNGIIKDGSIGEAAIHEGAITNAKIADATIEAAKIKSINADNITAGTLKTSRLIIADEAGNESIVKAINMANGIAEADVNGKQIQAASIDVADLSAFEAKIARFDMSGNAIYSGKTSISDPTSGIYISTTGIGIGDGKLSDTDESPIQMYADGGMKLSGKNASLDFNTVTGELNIEATQLKIGSKTVATKEDLNGIDVDTVKIGGRNLISGTSRIDVELGGYPSQTDEAYLNGITYTSNQILLEGEYVLSFEAKSTVTDDKIVVYFHNPDTVTSAESSTGYKGTEIDGYAETTLSTDWTRYWIKYKQQLNTDDEPKQIIVGQRQNGFGTGIVSVRAVKLEAGNVPTDWTPAPEDIEARVSATETSIESNSAEIALKASKTEVATISDSLNGYIDSSTKMIQDAQGWQFNWDKLIRTAEADVDNHRDYITLQNGNIILGESNSDLKVKIGNDAIQFKGSADDEITPDPDATAWITGQKFNINEGEIHNSLKVGQLQFLPRPNGNFSISIT